TRVQQAFLAACLDRGWPRVDLRQGLTAGVGALPKNLRDGRRVSTATLYLTAARLRENLTIRARCRVDRLLVERSGGELGVRAVEGLIDGERRRFSGGQVVLAAGAVHSPA